MALADYSTIPSNNTSAPGIDLTEGMLPGLLNDDIRQIMADLANWLLNATVGRLNINANNGIFINFTSPEANWALGIADGQNEVTLTENQFSSTPFRADGSGPTFPLRQRTVAQLNAIPASVATMYYCSNESGGAVPVFGDGVNWRRVTDRAIIS